MRSYPLLLLVCALCSLPAEAADVGSNVVQNGSFDVPGERGVAAGWSLSGPLVSASIEDLDGRVCQKIESTGKRALVFWQEVGVEPGTEYLFSAWVKSEDRVFARLGRRSLSYSEQDNWQKLIGLIRAGTRKKLKVEFFHGGLTQEPNALWISDVVLRRSERPPTPRRTTFGITQLVRRRKPAAYLVCPRTPAVYPVLVKQLQAAVSSHLGAALPIVSDTDATEADRPVLTEPYRDSHLILLGRLGTNRAMWPAYNRFLCAADGYYPGGNGLVVRTAANVLRNGKNHIILGGSSEEGVKGAVARFIELIRKVVPAPDGSFSLPWLADVELDGECLAAFQADDKLWTEDPWNSLLPPKQPGYGSVRRWYHNAMAYYWSGWDRYKQRATEYLGTVLEDQARTHHYLAEFFVRAYDMLDDSPLFTSEQRAAMDGLVFKNFWEFMTGPDLTWMTTFARPYDSIQLRNRHAIAPWMADLKMADFVRDYFDLKGEVAELVAFRCTEKGRFMRHLVTERWRASLPGPVYSGAGDEIAASMFRYALDHDMYEFFDRGNARRTLDLDRIDHLTGRCACPAGRLDHHLLLGILAHYHRDGRYAKLLNTLPIEMHPTGHFMGRYVNGVRRYVPGPEIEPANPSAFTGVRVPEMMPHSKKRLGKTKLAGYQWTSSAIERPLGFVSFRNGFEPDDDYVALTGLAGSYPPGIFLAFASCGTHWLGPSASPGFSPGTNRYFTQNAVSVIRTDRWLEDDQPYAAMARLNWKADLHRAGGVSFTLDPFMGTSWRRAVLWLRPRLYVVRDTVTAREDGQFQIAVTWRPNGGPSWDGTAWTSMSDTGRLRITPLGSRFHVAQNVDGFRAGRADELFFRHVASARLSEGESVTSTTVIQAFRRGDPVYSARLVQPGLLALLDGEQSAINVYFDGTGSDSIRIDEEALVIGSTRVQTANAAAAVLAAKPGPVSVHRGTEPSKAADAGTLQPTDRTANWEAAWSYKGLMRPTRIRPARRIADDVIDLGTTARLDEIRAVLRTRLWESTHLPDAIWTALPDRDGRMPPLESKAWRKLDAMPRWRASVRTGNYGRADPERQGFQVVRPKNLRARFVRAEHVDKLLYYDANVLSARMPMRLEVSDLDGDGAAEVFVAPEVWPPFVRKLQEEDAAFAVLDADGKAIWQHDSPMNIQSIRLLDYDGSGKKRIVVTTVDAQTRIFEPTGRQLKHLNMYAMHRRFNETEGRPNTRHPAGGLTMPFALGLWRPGTDGRNRIVVARYHCFSFIGDKGQFEGVLMLGSYVQAGLLPYGIDFNRDGVQEQLCISRGALMHLDGEAEPEVRDPGGARFYPQVYSAKRVRAPTWDQRLNGGPILAFKALPWGDGAPRYVLVVRDDYLGIYDGLERKWAFTWVPVVSLRAAAVAGSNQDSLRLLAVTADDLLWELKWEGRLDKLASFETRPLPDRVNRIRTSPQLPNQALLAGDRGLYLLQGNDSLALVARGSIRDAHFLSNDQVVAVSKDGEVLRFGRGTR